MIQPRLPFGAVLAGAVPEWVPVPVPVHPVFVRHRRAKRYVLRVRDDGTIRVTIPRGGSRREARAFAERERTWIASELKRVTDRREAVVDEGAASVQSALCDRAKRELPARLMELASRLGLTVSRISVRNQRLRWGSCSRAGHICLNWRLVQMPLWVRDRKSVV